jgi:hypothetical protein
MDHEARRVYRTIRKMGLVMVEDGHMYRVMGSDIRHHDPQCCLREVLGVLAEAERSSARHAKQRQRQWQR